MEEVAGRKHIQRRRDGVKTVDRGQHHLLLPSEDADNSGLGRTECSLEWNVNEGGSRTTGGHVSHH